MKNLMKPSQTLKLAAIFAAALPCAMSAQTTISQVVQADTFVSSGQPTVNFGSMGAMEIASPTASQPRTEESLLRFDTSAIESSFNTQFGAGNWVVTSISLSLFSNVSTAGQQAQNTSFNKIAAGGFELDWLSNDSWSEGGITWNTLPTILPGTGGNTSASLGTFNWPATGDSSSIWNLSLDPNLVNDIHAGGLVTIFGQPTSGSPVGYLFNTLVNNPGYLNVTANVVPEPSAIGLVISGLIGLGAAGRRKK